MRKFGCTSKLYDILRRIVISFGHHFSPHLFWRYVKQKKLNGVKHGKNWWREMSWAIFVQWTKSGGWADGCLATWGKAVVACCPEDMRHDNSTSGVGITVCTEIAWQSTHYPENSPWPWSGLLLKQKVHYHVLKIQPLVLILRQMNPVYILCVIHLHSDDLKNKWRYTSTSHTPSWDKLGNIYHFTILSHHIYHFTIISHHIYRFSILSHHIYHFTILLHYIYHFTILQHHIYHFTILSHHIYHFTTFSHHIYHFTILSHLIYHFTTLSHHIYHFNILSHLIYHFTTFSHHIYHFTILSHHIYHFTIISQQIKHKIVPV
jgi:hypothetical protein